AEQAALLLLKCFLQRVSINAGRGDMRSQAVHRQHGQRKQHAFAQVRYSKDIRKFLEHLIHFFLGFACSLPFSWLPLAWAFGASLAAISAAAPPISSAFPPALAIFSCADLENLCACTVNADLSSPSPRILIRSFFPARPCFTI